MGPTLSFAITQTPKNKYEYNLQNSQCLRAKPTYSQGSMAQKGSKANACSSCNRTSKVIVVTDTQVASSV